MPTVTPRRIAHRGTAEIPQLPRPCGPFRGSRPAGTITSYIGEERHA